MLSLKKPYNQSGGDNKMTKRKVLNLSTGNKEELTKISISRTETSASVRRAKILLFFMKACELLILLEKRILRDQWLKE